MDYVPGSYADLADVVKHSEIVRGRVTDYSGRFSHDEREVWTDYTISIQEIYKQGGKSNFAPGAKSQATRLCGHLVVYGDTSQWHPPEPIKDAPSYCRAESQARVVSAHYHVLRLCQCQNQSPLHQLARQRNGSPS